MKNDNNTLLTISKIHKTTIFTIQSRATPTSKKIEVGSGAIKACNITKSKTDTMNLQLLSTLLHEKRTYYYFNTLY